MYYLINSDTGMILESSDHQIFDPQKEADYFNCSVWIIEGEHSGLSASPTKQEADKCADSET